MKVGLKETLSLLAAGYKKKDIEALIAAEEEDIQKEMPESPSPEDKKAPAPAPVPENESKGLEPDLKKELETKQKELEEIQKKLKENEDKLKKMQQDNIHRNSAPEADEAKKKEAESLTNLVRSFM